MAGEQNHILCVLNALAPMLGQDEASKIRAIVERISRTELLDAALEDLYCVEGWNGVALRLMWYAESLQQSHRSSSDDEMMALRAGQLFQFLTSQTRERDIPSISPFSPPSLPATLADGLHRFGHALGELKRGAFDGTTFKGMERAALDQTLGEAVNLRRLAEAAQSKDVAQFADAFTRFIGFVLDRGLLGDIRVVNFIDNANITLQTASETVGEEDFDSLRQTIELLENPEIFLE